MILFLLVVAIACGEDDEASPPNLEITASPSASAIESPTPAAAQTAGPEVSLEDALAGSELLAQRSLTKPNLIYAVKQGRHVTVYKRNVATGEEKIIVEYDEGVDAEHSQNYWQEEVPSVALSESGKLLLYVREDGIAEYDLNTGTSSLTFRREEDPATRPRWVSESGAVLCCAYTLARPVLSLDGSRVALAMSQYEGSRLGVANVGGDEACTSESAASKYPAWSPRGQLLIPGDGGEYATPGLFIAQTGDPCAAAEIAAAPDSYFAGYESGSWSPDGEWVVTSLTDGVQPDPSSVGIRLLRPDGSDNQALIEEGFNFSPTFSPDGESVYFVKHSSSNFAAPTESIWRYDLGNATAHMIASVPAGWILRLPSWTEEGYLAFRLNSTRCYYWSCDNRLVLLDPASGYVVYASAARDFGNYLGFVP